MTRTGTDYNHVVFQMFGQPPAIFLYYHPTVIPTNRNNKKFFLTTHTGHSGAKLLDIDKYKSYHTKTSMLFRMA
ncbi:MAG: hypothetical protein ACYSYT_03475 [Planctomycetota bacterium]